MEKDARYFIVGLFVSAALAGLVFFSIWLAGTYDQKNFERYVVYFNDPVSGLKDGGVVQYRGVDVGRVRDVVIAPESNDLIKVLIEVEENTPVNITTVASLATQGLTGLAFINLTTEPGETGPPRMAAGERYPVIPGEGTQLSKVFQDVPAITAKILELTDRINKAFDDGNVESLAETLRNARRISERIEALLSAENIGNVGALLQNLNEGSEGLNDLVARFRKTADEIDEAAVAVNRIVADNEKNIANFTGTGLNQITEMSRETRDMARAIRRLADKLEQEPSRILYQPEDRGGVEIAP